MRKRQYSIAYPRKRVARGLVRLLGRLILPLFFRIRISGEEHFPQGGPLLVVGNHVAAIEAVLMAIFTPWQVEMLGAADIPHEKVSEIAMSVFGCIPVNRGQVDLSAMRKALDLLKQGGVLGLFPEGGTWEASGMRPQTGVAWLSYRTGSPVIPIGFGGTLGALGAALRLGRPKLTMNVGQLLPAARLSEGKARKVCLQEYATQVMDAVRELIPVDDPMRRARVTDERFELDIDVQQADGSSESFPSDLEVVHATALAKLLHRPVVLKVFRENLQLPVGALQNLAAVSDAGEISRAIQHVLAYLQAENPYFLTYRFGPKEAEAMRAGLQELLALAQWTVESGLALTVTPVRRYYSPERGEQVVQIEQGRFEGWM